MRIQKIFFESPSKNVSPLKSRQKNVRIVKIQKERKREMEEKKKQEFQVSENFEIEESNAMKVLRGKGEENENPHESKLPQKKVGWLENLWYHHKWHAGLIIGGVAIAAVLLVQLITDVPHDVTVLYTGPQAIVGSDYDYLDEAFKDAMGDYNEDGKKEVEFGDNTYLTQTLIEQRKALNPKYTYDVQANQSAFERYRMDIATCAHMCYMLDPELYRGAAADEIFVPLSEIFGEDIPECAYDECGIILGETEFYKSNSKIQYIPSDTVIAIRIPAVLDISSDKKQAELLETHKQFLRDLVEYTPEENEK